MRKVLILCGVLLAIAPALPARADFQIVCSYSHALYDDPIVHPNAPGSSHRHAFFANTSTDAASTYATMTAASTTCGLSADTSGYWVPTLIAADGSTVRPKHVNAYYGPGQGVQPSSVVAFPADLRIVAGGDTTVMTAPRPASWSCQGGVARTALPADCGTKHVLAHVKFPNCWDGVHLDSADHRSHMAYSSKTRGCPADHPVAVPALTIVVVFPITNGEATSLSSGAATTLHGDFWNTWDQSQLEQRTAACVASGKACGVLRD